MAITWMGIDGGGSTLRISIVDDNLKQIAMVQTDSANPNTIGHEEASKRIRQAIQQALEQAHIDSVTGAGIGIAGASAEHSAKWLYDVLEPALPRAKIHVSSDIEIAMVGGCNALHGMVLLAGTGSIAYGRRQDGVTHRAGGWGYLLGDEGSGYWIGLQALKSVTHLQDRRLSLSSKLPQAVLDALQLDTSQVIHWMYQVAKPADVARLAPLVLTLADQQDELALNIVENAATELTLLVENVQNTLHLNVENLTFAGGLLTSINTLSLAVMKKCQLSTLPTMHHPPVIGAALFAKLNEEKHAH